MFGRKTNLEKGNCVNLTSQDRGRNMTLENLVAHFAKEKKQGESNAFSEQQL